MKFRFLAVCSAIALMGATEAHAVRTVGSTPTVSRGSAETAAQILQLLNRGGNYSRDFYRSTFAQVMGLVFFDPGTPDIRACERAVFQHHLPNITRETMDFSLVEQDIIKALGQTYTEEELRWLRDFYASPFGQRMAVKQFQFNERIAQLISERYTNQKPQFQQSYKTTLQRCGGSKPSLPEDAPKLGSDILSLPTPSQSGPLPTSPEPARK